MNKGDLVNEVSKVVKTKKDAQAVVDCVLSNIMSMHQIIPTPQKVVIA